MSKFRTAFRTSASITFGFWLAIWWSQAPPMSGSRWWAYGAGIALALDTFARLMIWVGARENEEQR